jgi:hypothetical protein
MKRKARELAMTIFEQTQKEFPAIEFINIQEHPEQANRYWINVSGDIDEETHIAMTEFVAAIAIEILIAEGLSFAVMLDNMLDNTLAMAHHAEH